MKKYYSEQIDKILEEFNVSPSQGLSSKEVEERRGKYGENRLVAKKKKPFQIGRASCRERV